MNKTFWHTFFVVLMLFASAGVVRAQSLEDYVTTAMDEMVGESDRAAASDRALQRMGESERVPLGETFDVVALVVDGIRVAYDTTDNDARFEDMTRARQQTIDILYALLNGFYDQTYLGELVQSEQPEHQALGLLAADHLHGPILRRGEPSPMRQSEIEGGILRDIRNVEGLLETHVESSPSDVRYVALGMLLRNALHGDAGNLDASQLDRLQAVAESGVLSTIYFDDDSDSRLRERCLSIFITLERTPAVGGVPRQGAIDRFAELLADERTQNSFREADLRITTNGDTRGETSLLVRGYRFVAQGRVGGDELRTVAEELFTGREGEFGDALTVASVRRDAQAALAALRGQEEPRDEVASGLSALALQLGRGADLPGERSSEIGIATGRRESSIPDAIAAFDALSTLGSDEYQANRGAYDETARAIAVEAYDGSQASTFRARSGRAAAAALTLRFGQVERRFSFDLPTEQLRLLWTWHQNGIAPDGVVRAVRRGFFQERLPSSSLHAQAEQLAMLAEMVEVLEPRFILPVVVELAESGYFTHVLTDYADRRALHTPRGRLIVEIIGRACAVGTRESLSTVRPVLEAAQNVGGELVGPTTDTRRTVQFERVVATGDVDAAGWLMELLAITMNSGDAAVAERARELFFRFALSTITDRLLEHPTFRAILIRRLASAPNVAFVESTAGEVPPNIDLVQRVQRRLHGIAIAGRLSPLLWAGDPFDPMALRALGIVMMMPEPDRTEEGVRRGSSDHELRRVVDPWMAGNLEPLLEDHLFSYARSEAADSRSGADDALVARVETGNQVYQAELLHFMRIVLLVVRTSGMPMPPVIAWAANRLLVEGTLVAWAESSPSPRLRAESLEALEAFENAVRGDGDVQEDLLPAEDRALAGEQRRQHFGSEAVVENLTLGLHHQPLASVELRGLMGSRLTFEQLVRLLQSNVLIELYGHYVGVEEVGAFEVRAHCMELLRIRDGDVDEVVRWRTAVAMEEENLAAMIALLENRVSKLDAPTGRDVVATFEVLNTIHDHPQTPETVRGDIARALGGAHSNRQTLQMAVRALRTTGGDERSVVAVARAMGIATGTDNDATGMEIVQTMLGVVSREGQTPLTVGPFRAELGALQNDPRFGHLIRVRLGTDFTEVHSHLSLPAILWQFEAGEGGEQGPREIIRAALDRGAREYHARLEADGPARASDAYRWVVASAIAEQAPNYRFLEIRDPEAARVLDEFMAEFEFSLRGTRPDAARVATELEIDVEALRSSVQGHVLGQSAVLLALLGQQLSDRHATAHAEEIELIEELLTALRSRTEGRAIIASGAPRDGATIDGLGEALTQELYAAEEGRARIGEAQERSAVYVFSHLNRPEVRMLDGVTPTRSQTMRAIIAVSDVTGKPIGRLMRGLGSSQVIQWRVVGG